MSSLARKMRRDALRKASQMDKSARDAVVKLAQGQQTFQAQADVLIADMNRHFRAQQKSIEDNACVAAMSLFAWALHDKWGWGRKRLKRLLGQVKEINDGLKHAKVKLEEIIEQIEEETGLEAEYSGKTPFIFGGEPVVIEMLEAQLERIENEKAAAGAATPTTARECKCQ